MTGRILVVDDMEPNIRVLKAKLEAEYYEVLTAQSGAEAIICAREQQPDMILLDVMMPLMDGFTTCKKLKEDPLTLHIPVVMVTALDQQKDRVDGLQAGADDFLSKPIDDVALFARVRSLLRLNSVIDELRTREGNSQQEGVLRDLVAIHSNAGGKVLVIEDDERMGERIATKLGKPHTCTIHSDPKTAPQMAANGYDLVVVNIAASSFDGLRIVARIRANEATRNLPVLCSVDSTDKERSVRALDLGANDILERPVEQYELRARVRTLLQRRYYTDQLRQSLDTSMELAFQDDLTGLYNRRHMDTKLHELTSQSGRNFQNAVLLITDVDHFKSVNDTHGHQVGDLVLQDLAGQLRDSFRAIDIACRYGGEEFVVIMPDADLMSAKAAAERFRKRVEEQRVNIGEGKEALRICVSGGLTEINFGDTGKDVLKRADAALYHAKKNGRNRMIAARKQAVIKLA